MSISYLERDLDTVEVSGRVLLFRGQCIAGRRCVGWRTRTVLCGTTSIRKHRLRRVHADTGETLEVVRANRLHLGWRRPDAAELRTDAEASGSMAEK